MGSSTIQQINFGQAIPLNTLRFRIKNGDGLPLETIGDGDNDLEHIVVLGLGQ